MKTKNTTIFIFPVVIAVFFANCNQQLLPAQDNGSKITTSLGNGTAGSNSSYSPADDDRCFNAVRDAEKELRAIVQTHKIPEPRTSNPEFSGADKIHLLFAHIDAIRGELVRLKNQPKPKPAPAPPPKSNQDEKLRTEINELTQKVETQNQTINDLNEQIKKLNDQLRQKFIDSIKTPPEPEVVHRCKVQLKKSKKVIKDIPTKSEAMTFNFEFTADDIQTRHPPGSYKLESGDNRTYLTITNAKNFWSLSSELIVWSTKDHHTFSDRDLRKD